MSDPDQSPISVQQAKDLFADWKAAPALVLAVSGGPDSIALMWLAARWRRALSRGPRLIAVTVDHGLRREAAREARDVKRLASYARSAPSHAALDRRQAEDRLAGRGARGALSPAGAGRAGERRDAHPHRAYPRRSGRDAADADAARQRHRRPRGDGARNRARRRVAGAAVAGCFEIAADRDAGQGEDRLCRRSDQPRHAASRGRGCAR